MGRMQSDESDTQRVTIRAPKHLVEQYDEVLNERGTNRSADIREHIRSQVNQPVADGGLVPPSDDKTLADAYLTLRESAGNSLIPLRDAKSIIAARTNVPKQSVSRRVLKPLGDRGYIRRAGDPINQPMLEIR